MSDDNFREPEDHIITPPIAPPVVGYAVKAKTSTWPAVIGIIGIIFGVLGILGGIWGVVGSFLANAIFSMVPDDGSVQAMQEAQAEWMPMAIVVAVLSTGAAVLLLIGGLGVYRRNASGPRRIKIWAGAKVVVVAMSAFVSVQMQQATMSAVTQNDPNAAAIPPGLEAGMMAGMICMTLVWGLALPVFVLIWFSLKKIKAETAEWS